MAAVQPLQWVVLLACCLHRVAWDVETSFAQDNGLGGAPGPYYCILACEQWNSPLYCDSEHPQVCFKEGWQDVHDRCT